MRRNILSGVVLLLITNACGWVDSTGVQDGHSQQPEIFLEEGQVVALREAIPYTLDPGETFATISDGTLLSWQDPPLLQGNLPACAGVSEFDPAFSANSLQEACYDPLACNFYFAQQGQSNAEGVGAVFELTPPVLKAPVGLVYQLLATGPDGVEQQANFTFCLIAENEAPRAADDVYPVVAGVSLTVSAAGVLSNDTDDTDSDIRNQPLSVVLPAISEPSLAASFELFADGGFRYTPDPSIELAPGTSRTDTFEYQISDGSHTDSATVLINIVAADAAPVLLEPIPDAMAIVGISISTTLSEFFLDPEGGELVYRVDTTSLPPSGRFSMSPSGIFSGLAQPQDVGEWLVGVTVADASGQMIRSGFQLSVVENLPPESRAIPAQHINTGELFVLDTSLYFSDPEQQNLNFALKGMNDHLLTIDRHSGEISGYFRVPGDYEFSIDVGDGVNPVVTQSLMVSVTSKPNQAPAHNGLIANQSVELGSPIDTIVADFTDPNGDRLVYSMRGILPPGVTLSAHSGVVSGTPTKLGVYQNLSIVATDPAGAFAESDQFSITVVPATPNQAPVYSGSIPNQTIALGTAIAVIEGRFSDPDDDPLAYSVIGALPAGLTLSTDGVLTGRPERIGASGNLRLLATDPWGKSAQSDAFRITVTAALPAGVNQRPEYLGSITDRSLKPGEEMLPIKGEFSDPDGDKLVYRLNGTLPSGITLDPESGVVSGTPQGRGIFRNLRIIASDSEGLSAYSDRFSIETF